MISSQMGLLLPRCVLCSLCIIARKTVSSSQRLTRYLLITLWSLVAFTKSSADGAQVEKEVGLWVLLHVSPRREVKHLLKHFAPHRSIVNCPMFLPLLPHSPMTTSFKILCLFAINSSHKAYSHSWCSSCLYFSIPLKGMAAVGRAADEVDGVQVVSRLPEQEPDEDFEVEPSWISEHGASETSPLFPPPLLPTY